MPFMSQEDAIKAAEQEAELRRRAARQAVAKSAAGEVEPVLTVRVLKMGHDKIHMGHHVGGVGEAFYEHGEKFNVARSIALALEDRGYVEIEGEFQPELPQLGADDADTGKAGGKGKGAEA